MLMRKIYHFLLVAILSLASQSAWAWSYDLQAENEALASMNYQMYRCYDFFNGKYFDEFFTNGNGERVSGDGCLTLGAEMSLKVAGWAMCPVTSPVEMNNFYIHTLSGWINLRAGVSKDGLHNYGSGARHFAIADVKAGQIIVCQWGVADSKYPDNVVQPSTAISGGTACEFTNISDEIHALQAKLGETSSWDYDPEYPGDEEHAIETIVPGKSDNFSYWRAESDGYFLVEMQRGTAIQGLQIWLDASASETVSAPTYSIVEVDGDARRVKLTSGESTLGNSTTVWYGLEDGETDESGNPIALFLKDSEEVDHYEYTYVKDEEGNIVTDENGEPVVETETPVYKKVLDPFGTEGSMEYGPNLYDDVFWVSAENDINGDGYVTIAAATLSEAGNFSNITLYRIAVSPITLNAPSLTLVALEGTERTYSLSWTNNTLCNEPYTITVTTDDSEDDIASDEDPFSRTFTASQSISAKVSVQGYTDGETSQDVLNPGVTYYRKNKAKEEAGLHDWDFVHLTDVQYEMVKGIYAETIAYITPNEQDETKNDTTLYSREEFYKLVEEGALMAGDGVVLDEYKMNCGWTYENGKDRSTLNVIEGGNNQNANGFGYVEDSYVQLFNNGLSVSCPPNDKNSSCIFIYSNGDLGTYFMARPTLTFSREAAQYGEYVLIYQGAGGSNYTNWRAPYLLEVPETELLTATLNSGGIHVFYIDVYTTDELPEDGYTPEEEEDAISTPVLQPSTSRAIYDLSGRRVSKAVKGIYIIGGKKVVR